MEFKIQIVTGILVLLSLTTATSYGLPNSNLLNSNAQRTRYLGTRLFMVAASPSAVSETTERDLLPTLQEVEAPYFRGSLEPSYPKGVKHSVPSPVEEYPVCEKQDDTLTVCHWVKPEVDKN